MKYLKLILSLFILFFKFKFLLSGQITFWDFKLDYTNIGSTSQYQFIFSLENPIISTDYLKLVMPYSLHLSTLDNIPDNIQVNFTEFSSDQCSNSQRYKVNIYQYSGNIYYLNFLDNDGNLRGLQSNVIYSVNIFITIPPSTIHSGLYKDPIELWTVSSIDSNAIIYDSNPLFCMISHTNAPSSNLDAILQINDPNMNVLGNKYPIYINIYPKETIMGRSRIYFYLTNNNFLFTGNGCTLKTTLDSFGNSIEILDKSQYSCVIDTTNNIVKLTILVDIIANRFKIQLETFVINPNRISSNAFIKVRILYAYSNHIVAEKTITTYGLNTQTLSIGNGRLTLAWNLNYLTNMAPGKTLKIVRGDANPPSAYLFNSLRFYFKINRNFPENIEFLLNFNAGTSDAGTQSSSILEGSIIENFPGFLTKKPNCYVTNNDQSGTTVRQVICDNIGKLYSNKEYFIGFRMFFQYDVTAPNLPTDFSTIKIYTKTSNDIDSVPIIPTTALLLNIETVNNEDWSISATKNTVVTSQLASVSSLIKPETTSSGILGLRYLANNDNQRLIFNLDVPTAKATTTGFVPFTNVAITNSAGLYIVMNPIIRIDSTPELENTANDITNTEILVQQNISSSSDDNKIIIRISGSDTVALENLYTNSLLNRFSLKNAVISSPSSYYGDDSLIDFYFFSYDQIKFATPTYLAFFMTNAYTITTPKPHYLYFSMVNWYSGSTVNNDGDYLPTFIRIYGFLRELDTNKGNKKLAIFFDSGLSFYRESVDPSNKQVACSSSYGQATCYGFDVDRTLSYQILTNYKRIEVDFEVNIPTETANSFQLLIPVSTKINIFKINLFLAALKSHATLTNKGYYQPAVIYRLTGDSNLLNTAQNIDFSSDYSSNTIALSGSYISKISSPNYGFDLSQSYVGSLQKMIITATHLDSSNSIQPNSHLTTSSSNGAGFTMNLPWNYYTVSSSYEWPYLGVTQAEKCLGFQYNKQTNDRRYGVFCPMEIGNVGSDAMLNISNFLISNQNGVLIPAKSCFGYSKNSGVLTSLTSFSTSITLNPGSLQVAGLLVTPSVFSSYSKAVLLEWSIITKNPIFNNMKIIITFNSSLLFTVGSLCYIKHGESSYQKTLTCTATLSTSDSIQFTVSDCSNCPMNGGALTILHYGNDGPLNNPGGFTGNLVTDIVTKLASGTIVDKGIIFGTYVITYDFRQSKIQGFYSDKIPVFSSKNYKARTNISFAFGPTNRGIYALETVVIDLGLFVNENSDNLGLKCSILEDSMPVKLDNRWHSLSLSSLKTIRVIAKQDITLYSNNPRFILSCKNLRIPGTLPISPNITIALNDRNNGALIQDSSEIQIGGFLNNSYISSSNEVIKLFKTRAFVGSFADFYFNVSLNIDLMRNYSIFIKFPSYYLASLTQQLNNFACQINNVNTTCYLYEELTVVLTGFGSILQAYSYFLIRINGIIITKYATVQNFSLIFTDYNNNLTNLLRYGEVPDTLLSNGDAINNLIIYNMSIRNNLRYIRQLSQYSITFDLNSEILQQEDFFVIDLPFEWNFALSRTMPNCTLFKGLNTTNILKNCSGFGNQIFLFIESIVLSDNTMNYTLVLEGIYNPNSLYCKPNKPLLSFFNRTLNVMSYYSGYATNNIPNEYLFGLNTEVSYIQFNFSQQESSLTLLQGIYSSDITIQLFSSENGTFQYPLLMAVQNSGFITKPSNIYIYPGSSSISFNLATDNTVLPGSYAVQFKKASDPYEKYGDLPIIFCILKVDLYKISIPTGDSYQIPFVEGGISTPITLLLAENTPLNPFSLKMTIEDVNLNISFSDGSFNKTIVFSAGNKAKSFNLKLNYVNNTLFYHKTQVSFSIIDLQNLTYSPPNPITISFLEDLTETPTFLLQAPEISSGVTFAEILMNCDQNGVIYYGISGVSSVVDNLETLKENAMNFIEFDEYDVAQKQYGFILINDSNIDYNFTITIENLLSNSSYRILGFCVNQGNVMSVSVMQTFQTKWNGGYLQKIGFNFQYPLEKSQKESLICYLDVFFGFNVKK